MSSSSEVFHETCPSGCRDFPAVGYRSGEQAGAVTLDGRPGQRGRIEHTAGCIGIQQPRPPVVYLNGNVEIRKPFCVSTGSGSVCKEEMVLRADQAEYHPDTGSITPSGNVQVTFEELK